MKGKPLTQNPIRSAALAVACALWLSGCVSIQFTGGSGGIDGSGRGDFKPDQTTGSVFISRFMFCTFCFFSISFLKVSFSIKQEIYCGVSSERFNKDQHDSIFYSLEETLIPKE
jgi:hypothetical protein